MRIKLLLNKKLGHIVMRVAASCINAIDDFRHGGKSGSGTRKKSGIARGKSGTTRKKTSTTREKSSTFWKNSVLRENFGRMWRSGPERAGEGRVGAGRVGAGLVGAGQLGAGRIGADLAGLTGEALTGGTCVMIDKNVRRNRVECRFEAEN